MSFASTILRLVAFQGRYYSSWNKDIGHHGDCRIYSERRFCDCGLLHDLEYMDYYLAEVLFKDYNKDIGLHYGRTEEVSEEEKEKAKKLLEEVFGPIHISEEEVRYEYEEMHKIIKASFKDEESPIHQRLEEWLTHRLHSIRQ